MTRWSIRVFWLFLGFAVLLTIPWGILFGRTILYVVITNGNNYTVREVKLTAGTTASVLCNLSPDSSGRTILLVSSPAKLRVAFTDAGQQVQINHIDKYISGDNFERIYLLLKNNKVEVISE